MNKTKIEENNTNNVLAPVISTCGCKDKELIKVRVNWGVCESRVFLYCKDCIKNDVKKGMLVELL